MRYHNLTNKKPNFVGGHFNTFNTLDLIKQPLPFRCRYASFCYESTFLFSMYIYIVRHVKTDSGVGNPLKFQPQSRSGWNSIQLQLPLVAINFGRNSTAVRSNHRQILTGLWSESDSDRTAVGFWPDCSWNPMLLRSNFGRDCIRISTVIRLESGLGPTRIRPRSDRTQSSTKIQLDSESNRIVIELRSKSDWLSACQSTCGERELCVMDGHRRSKPYISCAPSAHA